MFRGYLNFVWRFIQSWHNVMTSYLIYIEKINKVMVSICDFCKIHFTININQTLRFYCELWPQGKTLLTLAVGTVNPLRRVPSLPRRSNNCASINQHQQCQLLYGVWTLILTGATGTPVPITYFACNWTKQNVGMFTREGSQTGALGSPMEPLLYVHRTGGLRSPLTLICQ